jgi:hypothetical protein
MRRESVYQHMGYGVGDFNNLTERGFYYCTNSVLTANKPFSMTYAYLLVMSSNLTDVIVQLVFNYDGKAASRVRNGGTWSAWKTVW